MGHFLDSVGLATRIAPHDVHTPHAEACADRVNVDTYVFGGSLSALARVASRTHRTPHGEAHGAARRGVAWRGVACGEANAIDVTVVPV